MAKKAKRGSASAATHPGIRKRDRRGLAEAVARLEKARTRRDRAQARVEALEALTEELAARLASAAAASVAAGALSTSVDGAPGGSSEAGRDDADGTEATGEPASPARGRRAAPRGPVQPAG